MFDVVDVVPGVQAVWARSGPKRTANAYLLGGDLLVEPVVHGHQDITDWHRLLAAWPKPFRAVLLTHLHLDHARGVDLIARHLKVPLLGPNQLVGVDAACEWQVLRTPGHSPEHLCFWDGSVLVGGDMLYDQEPAYVPGESDISAYRRSAAMLRSLHPKLLLPAHGRPVFAPDTALAKAEELMVDHAAE